MEKLEIYLPPELVKMIDEAVELLGFDSREELVLCAIRRHLDRYFIIPKNNEKQNKNLKRDECNDVEKIKI